MNLRVCSIFAGLLLASAVTFAAPKPTKVSTPIVSCGGSTQASINITVTAGATGLPAGFSVQWMTAADFAANNYVWPSSDTLGFCHASFSGNASGSRYNLLAGESATVNIGELLFDNGTSSSCIDALECGTDYVFRVFGHASSSLAKSDWSATLTCSTLACGTSELSCTYTQGYWKTHGPIPTGNNVNEWPVTSLTVGSVTYTDLQLLSILNTPASGNGLLTLAHQLIAAKLNVANGADPTDAAQAIADADALIGGLVIPPVGSGSLSNSSTSSLVSAITAYNEGLTGPGHCGTEVLP